MPETGKDAVLAQDNPKLVLWTPHLRQYAEYVSFAVQDIGAYLASMRLRPYTPTS
jgi:hypothetical protein